MNEATTRPALHPIGDGRDGSTPEYRIRKHAIARRRLEQPVPLYRVGDEVFDGIAGRLALPITHGPSPWSARVPCITYEIGTTTVHIFAGGPHLEWDVVELVEL